MVRTRVVISEFDGFLRETPFRYIATDHFELTAGKWENALGTGPTRKVFALEDTYTGPVLPAHSWREVTLQMKMRFKGDFSFENGEWSGEITSVQVFSDGEHLANMWTNGKIDLADIYGGTDSAALWDALSIDGYRSNLPLTSRVDFVGSSGDDIIKGREYDDRIEGGAGDDRIFGGRYYDVLHGGDGHDRIFGGPGIDKLYGEAGYDKLNGGGGHDKLYGGEGNDRLYGRDGRDRLNGGDGDDYIVGGNGKDSLNGGNGNDRLWGDRGHDFFASVEDFSRDSWFGGGGRDTFKIGNYRAGEYGAGVIDFTRKEDKVGLKLVDGFEWSDFDGVRYIGNAEFSKDPDVYEVRMENGIVEADGNGDGIADYGIFLDAHDDEGTVYDTFGIAHTGWLWVPGGAEIL